MSKDESVWIIVYEDQDVKPEFFSGEGAEVAAKHLFKERLLKWSCHLFVSANIIEQQAKELSNSQQTVEALMSSNCNMNDTLRSRGFTSGSSEERLIALAQSHDKQQYLITELESTEKDFQNECEKLAKEIEELKQLVGIQAQRPQLTNENLITMHSLRTQNERLEREIEKTKAQRDQFRAGLEICASDRERQLEDQNERLVKALDESMEAMLIALNDSFTPKRC
jgi:DNA repair exonuclease SbcCD ATPase subunit